jgi:hypothetical protein
LFIFFLNIGSVFKIILTGYVEKLKISSKFVISKLEKAIDGANLNAFFGSQNFTNYSTESIEITTQIDRYLDDGVENFFEYFENLLIESREATIEEINEAAGSIRYNSGDSDRDIEHLLEIFEELEFKSKPDDD